jgi:hypothetical protein
MKRVPPGRCTLDADIAAEHAGDDVVHDLQSKFSDANTARAVKN